MMQSCGRKTEQARDSALKFFRSGPGVGSGANRPSDHDVIGAVQEGVFDVGGALLVVGTFPVLHRADAGGHDEEPVAELLSQPGDLDPEETTPAQPSSRARLARESTSSSTWHWNPRASRSAWAGRNDSGCDEAGRYQTSLVWHEAAVAFPASMAKAALDRAASACWFEWAGVSARSCAVTATKEFLRSVENFVEDGPILARGRVLSVTYPLCPRSDAHSTSRKIRGLARI